MTELASVEERDERADRGERDPEDGPPDRRGPPRGGGIEEPGAVSLVVHLASPELLAAVLRRRREQPLDGGWIRDSERRDERRRSGDVGSRHAGSLEPAIDALPRRIGRIDGLLQDAGLFALRLVAPRSRDADFGTEGGIRREAPLRSDRAHGERTVVRRRIMPSARSGIPGGADDDAALAPRIRDRVRHRGGAG